MIHREFRDEFGHRTKIIFQHLVIKLNQNEIFDPTCKVKKRHFFSNISAKINIIIEV